MCIRDSPSTHPPKLVILNVMGKGSLSAFIKASHSSSGTKPSSYIKKNYTKIYGNSKDICKRVVILIKFNKNIFPVEIFRVTNLPCNIFQTVCFLSHVLCNLPGRQNHEYETYFK